MLSQRIDRLEFHSSEHRKLSREVETDTKRRVRGIKEFFLCHSQGVAKNCNKKRFTRGLRTAIFLCNNKIRPKAPCRVINRSSTCHASNLQLQYFHNYRRVVLKGRISDVTIHCSTLLFITFLRRLFKCFCLLPHYLENVSLAFCEVMR